MNQSVPAWRGRAAVCVCVLSLAVIGGAHAQRGGPIPFSAPAGIIPKPATIDIRSPNVGDRPFGQVIDSVVMHTTEVDLAGTLAIFQDSQSQVSAHFVIAPNGDLYQMVDTADRAWHATYYNNRSIGIEMVGFASSRSTWNADNLATLTELLTWLVTAYPTIPIERPLGDAYGTASGLFDQPGLVAHAQIQPWNRTDPGRFFPWNDIVAEVQRRATPIPEPAAALTVLAGVGVLRRRARA